MIKVSRSVSDRERISYEDDELYVAGEDAVHEEMPSELEINPREQKFQARESSLDLYLAEVGQTPLLSAKETKKLARQIEDGKHLARLEGDWSAEHGAEPSAVDLLLALAQRLSHAHLLLEAAYRHLRLPSGGGIAKRISHPELRRAIDDKIERHLSGAVSEIIGMSQSEVEQGMIELSLDSRLIPWQIMKEAGKKKSLDEFGKVVQSPAFRDKLQRHRWEIVKHFEKIREKARQATDHMIQANLRLVISVAKSHIGWGVPLPDLIQEGNIGLMQAVQKFDHRRGYRFSTYAILWIWQAINRAVNDKSRMVRLPGHVIGDLAKLTRARKNLAQKLGRQPTEEELTAGTGFSPEKIELLRRASADGAVSLDAPVGEEGSQLGDFIADQEVLPPEEQATASLLKEELSKALGSLTPRERRVIELRFGLADGRSQTLAEVGAELGLSKERIRQIEKEALAKLRHRSRSHELIGYLD